MKGKKVESLGEKKGVVGKQELECKSIIRVLRTFNHEHHIVT